MRPILDPDRQEIELVEEEVLGHFRLRGHVGDPRQGQHLVRAAGGQQSRRELQGVRRYHVVVGETVDEHEWTGE